jgi:hypothetical protein
MFNRLLCTLACVFLLNGFSRAEVFDDLHLKSDQDLVSELVTRGYFKVATGQLFYPNAPITRADFSVLLTKAAALTTPFISDYAYYRDVSLQHWAYPAIEALRMRGILPELYRGFFKPEASLSRKEAMVMVSGSLKSKNIPLTAADSAGLEKTYKSELALLTAEQKQAVCLSLYTGMLLPQSSIAVPLQEHRLRLNLEHPLTRMEAAYLIYRRDLFETQDEAVLKVQVAKIPSKTLLHVSPSQAIAPDLVYVGDTLFFSTTEASLINELKLERGSRVFARVTEIAADKTSIRLEFFKMEDPSGVTYALEAPLLLYFDHADKKHQYVAPGQQFNIVTTES